jgi:hypothetical protein
MMMLRPGLLALSLLLFIFLLPLETNAQVIATHSYLFLEVIDGEGKPVAKARVDAIGENQPGTLYTDEKGAIEKYLYYHREFHNRDIFPTKSIKISKDGYITQEVDMDYHHRTGSLIYPEKPEKQRFNYPLLRVELYKSSPTEAERAIMVQKQRQREIVMAVIDRQYATVERLLKEGVSPDSTDVYGIPAILYAANQADEQMMRLLLSAGADVSNKARTGRKVLLYYLHFVTRNRNQFNRDMVKLLLDAGADVNATNNYGQEVLRLARTINDKTLIEMIEKRIFD